MTLATLLNRTVTVQRRAVTDTDVYGNDTVELTSVAIVNGYIEQTDAAEVTIDRTTYTTTHLVMLDAGTDVRGGDRLVCDGVSYEVIGPPDRPYNPRARATSHIECRARVVTG